MTIPLPPGQAPYITAPMLLSGAWPVGVDFSTLPPSLDRTAEQTFAAVTDVAAMATAACDECVNQPLRCVLSTEELQGPDFRVTVQNHTGNGRVILQRWPVTYVQSVQVAVNAAWPRQWQTVPAGMFEPENPVVGLYGTSVPSGAGEGGQSILIAPCYVNRSLGRNGWRVKVTYYHAWPHTALTALATQGDSALTVDDCTGWAPFASGLPGAAGVLYDGGSQEAFSVSASSASSGPGTLTLAAPLAAAHAAGVMASSLPQTAIWAAALYAGAAALVRGGTATTIQEAPGRGSGGGGGGTGAAGLRKQAAELLSALARTI